MSIQFAYGDLIMVTRGQVCKEKNQRLRISSDQFSIPDHMNTRMGHERYLERNRIDFGTNQYYSELFHLPHSKRWAADRAELETVQPPVLGKELCPWLKLFRNIW